MDYIFLFIAVFGFVGQFLITKLYQRNIKETWVTSLVFYVIVSAVNALVCFFVGGCKLNFSGFSLLISLFMAIVMMLYQVISIKILSLGNMGIYSMFMMLGGMALPFLYGVVFLQEDLTETKIVGVILLSVFLILQVLGEKTQKKTKLLFYALCFAVFFVNGMSSVLAKMHQINDNAVDSESFIVIYSLISVVFGVIPLIVLLCFKKDNQENRELLKQSIKGKTLLISISCAGVSTAANYFHVLAAKTVPASVQFPIVSGGTIVFTAIAALLFFKEKQSKKGIVCIIGAFVATVLFMF